MNSFNIFNSLKIFRLNLINSRLNSQKYDISNANNKSKKRGHGKSIAQHTLFKFYLNYCSILRRRPTAPLLFIKRSEIPKEQQRHVYTRIQFPYALRYSNRLDQQT